MLLRPTPAAVAAVLASAAVLAGLAGCGSDPKRQPDGTVHIVAGFYPLQFVAEQVGGDRVRVTNLVQPGAEPHDLELGPRQMASVADANLVVYLAGFQPAVDEAVHLEAKDTSFDAGTVVPLLETVSTPGQVPGTQDKPATTADHKDPHIWLDPNRLAAVADALAERLASADPAGAATYRQGAAVLRSRLAQLDQAYAQALQNCQRREIVVGHAAFGYLAERYHLTQVAIAGLSPDVEPTPQRLAQVTAKAREHDATTIFFETLTSPKVAQVIATETGARTAVLDPIEGLVAGDGSDYMSVMRENLSTLSPALGCQ
jgi:zinc transport system substrate-binding protein